MINEKTVNELVLVNLDLLSLEFPVLLESKNLTPSLFRNFNSAKSHIILFCISDPGVVKFGRRFYPNNLKIPINSMFFVIFLIKFRLYI